MTQHNATSSDATSSDATRNVAMVSPNINTTSADDAWLVTYDGRTLTCSRRDLVSVIEDLTFRV